MLSEPEKTLAEELLSYLTEEEICALAKTITKNEIALRSTADALHAILEFSEDALELLNRRKLKREVLVQYLADQGCSFSINTDKSGLCFIILQHWGSTTSPISRRTIRSSSRLLEPISTNRPSCSTAQPQTEKHQSPVIPIDYIELARHFALWFYPMVNATTDTFGPQHFYEDCSLLIKCISREHSNESHEGAESVACRMLQFVQRDGLTFCPNTQSNGLRGICDDFGIATISVCGTVQKGNQCIGVFKQQFVIAKDVTIDSWKVKRSRLMLVAEEVSSSPSLAQVNQLLSLASQ